jgi:uncharacterized membrane protein
MSAEILVLRLVHVLGGIFWVGSGLFSTFFLVPAIMAAGPAAGPVMGALQQRRLFTILPVVALLTVLSGLRLMWIISGGFRPEYFQTRSGATFAIAAVASIIAFALSVMVARPMAVRGTRLAGEMARAPEGQARAAIAAELARIRSRGSVATMAGVVMLVIAASGMAVARYL